MAPGNKNASHPGKGRRLERLLEFRNLRRKPSLGTGSPDTQGCEADNRDEIADSVTASPLNAIPLATATIPDDAADTQLTKPPPVITAIDSRPNAVSLPNADSDEYLGHSLTGPAVTEYRSTAAQDGSAPSVASKTMSWRETESLPTSDKF